MTRSLSALFPHEILNELCDFSGAYFGRVLAGDAYKSEQEGGGYALESSVRPNHHIPTGTAPFYIANLAKEFERRATDIDPYQCGRLGQAIKLIGAAVDALDRPNGPYYTGTQIRHLRENADNNLPIIADVHARLEARVAAPS